MRTRPHALVTRLALASAFVSLASLIGCSSGSGSGSDSSGSTAALVPTADQGLAGEYVADDATSAFSSITFVDDTRYILQPTTCPDANDCRQQGSYTLAGEEVTLHDDLGDPAQTFDISVLSGGDVPTDATTDSDAGVTAQSETVALGTADLVNSSGSLYSSRYQVYSLQMNRSSYHLVNSSGKLVNTSNASTLVTPNSTGALVGSSLLFEGSCSFLHSCSSFSEKLPAGEVSWGCTGVAVCSDTAHWLAGPTSAYCGKTVTVCKGSTCTTGTVLDVSNAGAWEGSEGLLGAIGLPYGMSSTCSGYGGGAVTIKE